MPEPLSYRKRSSWVSAHELADGGLPQPRRVDAAHHGDREPARLAHHQLGGRGQLVGHGHLGHLHGAAEGVGRAPQVDDRGDAGHADGHVGQALAPRPAERVGHDHAHRHAEAGAHDVADAPGRAVAVEGQQRGLAPLDVREVDPAVGAHEAVARLGDDEVAAAPEDPHRFVLDDGLVGERVVGVDRHQPALGLRDDLLGHDEHVAVEQRAVRRPGAGGGDELAELVARADLADALDAPDS